MSTLMRFCPSTSNQNILLAKLSEESSRKGAIAKSTNAKFTIWRHCKSCFSFIRFSNDWNLDSFSSDKKHTDSWAFCHAIEDSRLHAKSLKNNKKRNQLEPCWTMYHRYLCWLTDLIPDSMEMGNLPSFCNNSFGDIEPQISLRNTK
jgi:hypothetical protein